MGSIIALRCCIETGAPLEKLYLYRLSGGQLTLDDYAKFKNKGLEVITRFDTLCDSVDDVVRKYGDNFNTSFLDKE